MGKAEREKGKRFERSVTAAFGMVFPDAKRTGWMQGANAKEPTAAAVGDFPDVIAGPFDIETKHKKTHQPWAMMAQAIGQARATQWAIGVMRRKPNEPTLVVMELGDFLELVRQWKKETE